MDQPQIVDITPLREGRSAPEVDKAIFEALSCDFFVGIKGYDPAFDQVGAELRRLWGEMAKQPQLFTKYDGKDLFYQRGTRAGMVRPGEVFIQDPFRTQIMLGPRLEPDNPLNDYHPYHAHLPNRIVEEVPELIPTAEAYHQLQSEHDLLIAEALERTMQLPRGFFAARLVWGNSVLRGLDYRVQGIIKDKKVISGMEVRGKEVNGVTVYDVLTSEGLVKNVTLISPHDDVDFWADLMKLKGSLNILRRDGSKINFRGQTGVKLLNTGIQASHASAYWNGEKRDSYFDGGVHWAEIENAEPGDIIDYHGQSVIVFTHPRFAAPIAALDRRVDHLEKPSYTNVILREVLAQRGHEADASALSRLEQSLQEETALATGPLSDREMITRLLDYEKRKGIHKLRRYEEELPNLIEMWLEGHRQAA